MLVQGIKSRPQYEGLRPDNHASNHIIVADSEGAQAVLDMLALMDRPLKGCATIIYAKAGFDEDRYEVELYRSPVNRMHVCPSLATAIKKLDAILAGTKMGTRIYAAGTETLIGLVVQLAQATGLDARSVITEHRGSLARRVQCVHCKGFTNNVTTNIVECSHCGEKLLVRDHYSRRIGAFMGVCANAEDPSDLPAIEEVFQ
ncbi:MAG: dimethylamine monooxygenase subunit DmmA family protein [Hyphomicrobiaceae bacterium]